MEKQIKTYGPGVLVAAVGTCLGILACAGFRAGFNYANQTVQNSSFFQRKPTPASAPEAKPGTAA